ncbi:N-acetyl-1-D-myo-inositol-2-amino-2-deoxy-alpha-D-glucopyranoside deacetylase [Streptomyces albidus (ex Kaewkla and Franco 2022)]|uniref:N-acetyl-1-D-myo-inositol-2-amino-2-deoxy-alpha- D-glucopyranoside deacetylase n=1 Tax=Streptomyces albidus (ex Kaewkla and Franco 2022) TaxID=722709 RepID=UPI0015EF09A3|nr:N-acetyl-1-D-myo-inositol-2-amino-2-deoxy-alpha-D-glucopyranoside deacetylase [Streptomyces albidus (ex Kaewkla and Franco 2022)]
MSTAPGRRLMLVHAHPDDESINNGATMAKYAAEGARVTLVTCTLGEEGEVIPPELAHLAPQEQDEDAPAGEPTPLGAHRMDELAEAMRRVGVTDHRFLGAPGRYRDSGMMGLSTNERPGSFWGTPLDEAAMDLVPVIREVRPQVLVTYDPDGGYGHPDHIKAHRVAMRAAELAADPGRAPEAGEPHEVARIYWNCVPRSALEGGFARLRAAAADPGTDFPFPSVAEPADVPGVMDDDEAVDVVIDGSAYAEAKKRAMSAHATQITVVGDSFVLSNGLGQPLLSTEYYRSAHPSGDHGGGIAKDLFAGVGV